MTPQLQVLADFSGTAYGSAPTFTDVTSDVLAGLGFDPITVTSWRQDQYSDITPTQAQVTFNNASGAYTAGNDGLTLNLLSPDVASPGVTSGGVTNAAPTLGASVTVSIDLTQKLPGNAMGPGPANSLKVNIPAGLAGLARAEESVMFTALPSTVYSFAAQVNATGSSVGINPVVSWYTSASALISRTFALQVTAGTTGYGVIANTTSPSNAAFFTVGCAPNTSPGSSTSCYIGNFCVVTGASVVEEVVAKWYPHVRRRVRARINAIISGTTVNLADVYADSWNVVADRSAPWQTQYSGTDILGRMAADSPLRGWLAEESLVDLPSCLYPLQEAEGSTSFGDVTNQQGPTTIVKLQYGSGVVTAAQTPNLGLLNATYVGIAQPAGTNQGSWLSVPTPSLSGPFTLETWIVVPTTTVSGANPIFVGGPALLATPHLGGVFAGSSPIQFVTNITATGTGAQVIGTLPADGNAHHLVVTLGADQKTLTVYVDGASIGSQVAASAIPALPSFCTASLGMLPSLPPTAEFSGGFSFFALYPTALSAGRVLAHYNAGAFAAPEGLPVRTDQRIAHLLTYRPNLGSSLDTGLGFMGIQDISNGDVDAVTDGQGETLQQALFDCGDVEGGVVYADGLGQINFRSRSRNFNPTSVATINCNQSGVDISTNFRDDILGMVNDETVSRVGGADSRYFNAASQGIDGYAATTVTLPIDTDSNALQRAAWDVYEGIQEQYSAPSLVIDLIQAPAATALAALQLNPLDVVTITNLPNQAPGAPLQVQIQGRSLSLGQDAMSATFVCTPLPPAVSIWDSLPGWDAGAWAY